MYNICSIIAQLQRKMQPTGGCGNCLDAVADGAVADAALETAGFFAFFRFSAACFFTSFFPVFYGRQSTVSLLVFCLVSNIISHIRTDY